MREALDKNKGGRPGLEACLVRSLHPKQPYLPANLSPWSGKRLRDRAAHCTFYCRRCARKAPGGCRQHHTCVCPNSQPTGTSRLRRTMMRPPAASPVVGRVWSRAARSHEEASGSDAAAALSCRPWRPSDDLLPNDCGSLKAAGAAAAGTGQAQQALEEGEFRHEDNFYGAWLAAAAAAARWAVANWWRTERVGVCPFRWASGRGRTCERGCRGHRSGC